MNGIRIMKNWKYTLLIILLSLIRFGVCSVTVVAPDEVSERIFEPAPSFYYVTKDFNITGTIVLAEPINGCEIHNDIAGKIVIANLDKLMCLADTIMHNIMDKNGIGLIVYYDGITSLDTYVMSRAVDEPIPLPAVTLLKDWNVLLGLMNTTNTSVIVTMTSGDFNEVSYVSALPSFWALYILLALVGLSVTIYGLVRLIGYISFYGPQFSISQTALSLQTLSAAITCIANTTVIAHFNYWPMPDAAYFTLYGLGPLLMVFSTILVGLFWSGLIWNNKKERFWNKYLFGIILAILLALFALNILSNIFFRGAVWALLVLIVIIALIVGLYFIIVGSVLVHQIVDNSRTLNVVSKKQRYPQRLVKMLILTGVSMILFVIVSMLTISSLYTLNAGWNMFVLSLNQFFTMTTVAAEITLFKHLKINKKKSKSKSSSATKTGNETFRSTSNVRLVSNE